MTKLSSEAHLYQFLIPGTDRFFLRAENKMVKGKMNFAD
jgi:hypothetical protein